MGAGRGRLVRQLLTESFVVSIMAGVLGVAVARGLLEAMIAISVGTEELVMMAELSPRVLGFTLLIALIAPVVFGTFPALRASMAGAVGALRDGRSSTGGQSGKKARSALVGIQVALALSLMIVAGLLSRTMIGLSTGR